MGNCGGPAKAAVEQQITNIKAFVAGREKAGADGESEA